MRSNVLLAFALSILMVGGCSSGNNTGGGGSGGTGGGGSGGVAGGGSGGTGGGGSGGEGGGPGGGGVTDGGVPTGQFYVTTGQYQVAAGSETVMCSTLRLPTSVDVDVTKIEATLTTGGHHLIMYRVTDTTEAPTPTPCDSVTNILSSVPMIIAQNTDSTLQLPTGVAYHFAAGQMVRLEMHYLNASQMPLMVEGRVTMTPGDPTLTYQAADIMFCGSVAQLSSTGLAPNMSSIPLNAGFFKGNSSVDFSKIKVFGLTTHQHWTGKEAVITKSTSASDPGTMLYDNTHWDAAPLKAFDDSSLVTFASGEGLRWQCTYDTQDASPKPLGTVKFGETARSDEMCFLWAYYYPSVGRFVGQSDCWQ
jgi:hypothetical protein